MTLDIFIEIKGKFNSRELWSGIERTGVNLTDIGDSVLVYGNTELANIAPIITTCAALGEDLHIHITRPK